MIGMEGVVVYESLAAYLLGTPCDSPCIFLVHSPMKRAPSLESEPFYGSCLYGGEEEEMESWLWFIGFLKEFHFSLHQGLFQGLLLSFLLV